MAVAVDTRKDCALTNRHSHRQNRQLQFFHNLKTALATFAAVCTILVFGGAMPEAEAASEDSLIFVGSPYLRKTLMKPLIDEYQKANPEIEIKMQLDGGWNDWFSSANRVVAKGKADLMMTSRLDWTWRAQESDKENMQYVAVAQEPVDRAGKEVGSVEYGLAIQDPAGDQAQKFIDFIQSTNAEDVLSKMDNFVPPDVEIQTPELPAHWREKPWKSPHKPKMVHGVDVHRNHFRTATIAELQKIKLKGYNSVMLGGHSDAVCRWADRNGLMLSGLPQVSEKERQNRSKLAAAALKTREHPSLWNVYLRNEDRVGKRLNWLVKLANDETPKHGNEKSWSKWRTILKNFPEYLKEKHGSLEVLNRRWNTSYDKWEDIDFPNLKLDKIKKIAPVRNKQFLLAMRLKMPYRYYYMANEPALLDAYRYTRQEWAKKYEKMVAEIKPNCREDFLYSTKTGDDPYAQRAVKSFNAASWDHTVCKFPPHPVQTLVDTVQTALDRPLWNSEAHLYNTNHDYRATPQRVRYVLLRNFICGEFQNTTYDRSGHMGESVEKIHKEAIATRNFIRKHEDVFRSFMEARSEAGITVLATEGNRAWNTLPDTPERPDLGGTVEGYAHASALGKHWKYVLNRDVSAEHVKDALIIDAPWLMAKTLKRIVQLPRDRKIIVVGDVPVTNEYNEQLPADLVKQFRKRMTRIDTWGSLDQVISPAEGLPQAYQKVVDAKFWYWTPWMGQYQYTIPVPALEVRRVQMEDKTYVTVINHSEKGPVEAPIPWAGDHEVRVLTNKEKQSPLDQTQYKFRPESVVIFKLIPRE